MKICAICQQEKPLDEFCNYRRSKDGKYRMCKDCQREYDRARWAAKSREQKNAKNEKIKLRRQANMDFIWKILSESPCVDCGESDPLVLDFDRRDDVEKKANVGALSGYSKDTILAEISKCDVRCANCHRRRTAKQFGWYAWRERRDIA